MSVNESRSGPRESSLLMKLGIRSSLLLGFGAMTGIMVLSVLAAVYFYARVNAAISDILESQLPATVHTFEVARAADALASSGLSLATLSTTEARNAAFERVNRALESLNATLEDLRPFAAGMDMTPLSLFADLDENLRRLQEIVDDRILLQGRQANARKHLLANLQDFQRLLTFRIRILEGDGDVISRLMAQPDPPVEKVANMSVQLAKLLPVARFYATVESINGRLLAASQSPTLTILNTSRQELALSLASLRESLETIPIELGRDLIRPVEELNDLILYDDGLIHLRERELLLLEEIQKLNAVNQTILQSVNAKTERMVSASQNRMSRTGAELLSLRQRSMLILVLVAGLGLLGVACLMHFYVNREVINRLTWLSTAMQDVASGRLETKLPPAGNSELGRLGAALRQFRTTAAEAREREAALQASNQRAEEIMEALEAKKAELELANSKLTELSIRDPLTGLFNRRRFDEALELEWARAGHGGKALAIIILDVDLFKQFNDRYGHQAGDACLKNLAAVFKSHAQRAGDVAARYGGEEFCMICPYTDMDSAAVLARSIHQAVLDLAMSHEGSPPGVVTVSIGYAAAVPHREYTYEDLLKAADNALYAAKAAGRNCVCGTGQYSRDAKAEEAS